MRAVRHLQKEAITSFLTHALLSDQALIEPFGEPRNVLQSVLGRPPYEEDQQGKISLAQQELPALCVWVLTSEWKHNAGGGRGGYAHFTPMAIAYVMAMPQGSDDIQDMEVANNAAFLVWDRVCRALQKGKLTTVDKDGSTVPLWRTTGDITKDGFLDEVNCISMVMAQQVETNTYGWIGRLDVMHRHPPFELPAAVDLNRIDADLFLDTLVANVALVKGQHDPNNPII